MGARTHNTFFTSDWHLGHANILKFSNRPFSGTKEMERTLIKRHNAVVRDRDITYFLGDMGRLGGRDLLDVMEQLRGTKVIIIGNHDKNSHYFLSQGFSAAVYSASLIIANELVTMSHYPLLGTKREDTSMYPGREHENWYGEDKAQLIALPDRGQFHLHGHLHAPNRGRSLVINGRQRDMGIDGNNYMLYSIAQIESWIMKTKSREEAA